MCQLEGAFGQLHVPLPINKVDLQFSLLHLVAKMHQLHVCKVGISEIQNVYVLIWQEVVRLGVYGLPRSEVVQLSFMVPSY